MTNPDDRLDSFIERLTANAPPVRRLWPPAIRLLVWFGMLMVVAALAVTAGLRPDAAARLASPGFLGELTCLGAAAVAGAWIAFRGAVPGLDGAPARRVLAATILAAVVLGSEQTHVGIPTSVASFVDAGIPCALTSVLLALAPWVAVCWSVWRGFPLRAAPTFAAGGLAASLTTYALMRLRCPLDETMHVAVWHGAPVVLATVAAAALGMALARFRPVTQPPR